MAYLCSMNRFVAIVLSMSIIFATMGQTILFIHYSWNKAYYASVLCENKLKPKMHCNGHCRLAKELKQQEKNSNMPSSPLKEKNEMIQFFQSNNQSLCFITSALSHSCRTTIMPLIQGWRNDVFHPPCS
jgi:hypothetical protein